MSVQNYSPCKIFSYYPYPKLKINALSILPTFTLGFWGPNLRVHKRPGVNEGAWAGEEGVKIASQISAERGRI